MKNSKITFNKYSYLVAVLMLTLAQHAYSQGLPPVPEEVVLPQTPQSPGAQAEPPSLQL